MKYLRRFEVGADSSRYVKIYKKSIIKSNISDNICAVLQFCRWVSAILLFSLVYHQKFLWNKISNVLINSYLLTDNKIVSFKYQISEPKFLIVICQKYKRELNSWLVSTFALEFVY